VAGRRDDLSKKKIRGTYVKAHFTKGVEQRYTIGNILKTPEGRDNGE